MFVILYSFCSFIKISCSLHRHAVWIIWFFKISPGEWNKESCQARQQAGMSLRCFTIIKALLNTGSGQCCFLQFQACTVLAKQLVNVRNQKTKTYAMGSRMQSIGCQQKVMPAKESLLTTCTWYEFVNSIIFFPFVQVMHSNMKMADAMGTTTKVNPRNLSSIPNLLCVMHHIGILQLGGLTWLWFLPRSRYCAFIEALPLCF